MKPPESPGPEAGPEAGKQAGKKCPAEPAAGNGPARKAPASYHHGNLRNALIQAGIKLLHTEGAHQLSLREAARVAGVSQAAPYRHFTNKEALLAAIAQEGFVVLRSMLREAGRKAQTDASCRLTEASCVFIDLTTDRPDHFRLMFGGVAPLDPDDHPELSRAATEAFEELVLIIRDCQARRELREGDTRQIAMTVWCSSYGLAHLALDNRLAALGAQQGDAKAALLQMTRQLIEGLKPR